jgi:hypothetical protein
MKKPAQFSMQTMFWAVTFVCIALWFAVEFRKWNQGGGTILGFAVASLGLGVSLSAAINSMFGEGRAEAAIGCCVVASVIFAFGVLIAYAVVFAKTTY